MATDTVDDRIDYEPGMTLGRHACADSDADLLERKIAQLDALLAMCSVSGGPEPEGFFQCNEEIQAEVLGLAAELARAVHELHTKASIEGAQHG